MTMIMMMTMITLMMFTVGQLAVSKRKIKLALQIQSFNVLLKSDSV